MMAAAAFILGISLIFMGVVIIGSSLGWWHIQEDVWGWIIAVLATVSRWVSSKVQKTEQSEPENLNGESTKGGPAVLLVLLLLLPGCAGLSAGTKDSLNAYGGCVGSKAIACAGQATGQTLEQKAIEFSACMAGGAILCVPTATAQSNPPGDAGASSVDLVCLKKTFDGCHGDPKVDQCVEAQAGKCAK